MSRFCEFFGIPVGSESGELTTDSQLSVFEFIKIYDDYGLEAAFLYAIFISLFERKNES